MNTGYFLSSLQRACLFALAMASASAAPKFDLERVTPVPAEEAIPTMDFFRPRVLSRPVLNPSGTHVAAIIAAAEDKHLLLVYDIKTQKIETVSGPRDKDVYRVDWLNDSRLVFGLSSGKLFGIGLMAADVGLLDFGYPIQQYSWSSLVSVPLKNPLRPLVWNRREIESNRDDGVAVIDTDNHGGKLVDLSKADADWNQVLVARDNNDRNIVSSFGVPPTGITYGYLADKEGELAYGFISDNGNLALYRLAEKQWIKCPVDLEKIDVVGAGNEPGQLLVVGPRQEGKPRALQLMDAATGQLGEVIYQDPAYDFEGWLYSSPATGDVLGAVFDRNGPRVVWFNEEYRKLQKALDGFFPGLVVRIYGSDKKHSKFLVGTYSDKQPVTYSWVDLETGKAGLIKKSAPWIDPQRMQPMNIIKFKTRDGRQLDAYLTLPAGASKTNPPPLVVLPHGGPWARDTWGFDGEAQFLASHGYAVLKPNYRGSSGYNWMFPVQDQWDFLKMHDDVTDSVKTMIASGLIDKDRVAIMGASFGGYLAISGVVHEPALYRCAITNAGVFDYELQVQTEKFDRYALPYYAYMIKKLGDPKKEPEKFAAISPGRHVEKIRVPVFVAGGKDDQTVEIEQSKRLIAELEKYKVPHEKLLIREEGHGMRHLKNEVELYDRILAFLDKYLKPARPVADSR